MKTIDSRPANEPRRGPKLPDGLSLRVPARLALLFALLWTPLIGVHAATRTWTGAAIGATAPFWNNITNWSGFAPPANGDDLVFPVTAGNKSSVNNLALTNYGTIFFTGSNYVFSGAQIALSGGLVATNRNGTNTFVTPVMLRASQTFTNGLTFGGTLQIAGSLNLNGNDLTLQGGGDVRVVSSIFGGGDIIKGGFGDLILQAANPFSGTLYAALGSMYVRHPLALGDTNFPIVVTNITRRLFLGTNIVVTNKSLQLGTQAELWGEGGTNGWTGPIALTGTDPSLRLDNGGEMHLGGIISGGGNWHVVGPGTAVLEGSQANTASGNWDWGSGATVLLNKTPGLTSGHRYLVAEGSTVRLLASDQLSNSRSLILSDGTLDLNGFSDTIVFVDDSSTNGSGRILFGSSGTNVLTFGSTTTTSIFSGTLTGAGDWVKIGGSTHFLRGTNSSTGDTIINGNGGALAVDGRITGLTIVTNGMLTGTGRVAAVLLNGANAVLNPGLGTNTTGRLTISGNSSWLAGKVQLELNGLVPGTQYDQIQLAASLAITNCALQFTLGFVPALGNSFVIVTNTAAGPINGIFAGLPEGATFTFSNLVWSITYQGGNGNDVVLSVIGVPPTGVTRIWTGAGANGFWTTGLNWGGPVPQSGDSLQFPLFAARKFNTNAFPPGTAFNQLLLSGGYNLSGSNITLLGGVREQDGFSRIELPLTLANSQTFTVDAHDSLAVGNVNIGVHTLTLDCQDATFLSMDGVISGSGNVVKTGTGVCNMLGTNNSAGTNFITAGEFRAHGVVTTGRVIAASGTEVNGTGFIQRLESAGRVAPGEDFENGLTLGSELRLTNGVVLAFGLRVPDPGETTNQIVLTNTANTVVLSNATLEINFLVPPTVGQTFTIIDKAGNAPVLGTFANLPEGSFITVGDHILRLTYVGGTGNDVVLTVVSAGSTGVSRVWTGGGAGNTNWSNPTNWLGGIAPVVGDSLIFPSTSSFRAFNDFPSSVIFDQLRLGTGTTSLLLLGNEVPLLSGLVVTNASFSPFVVTPIRLLTDQSVLVENGGVALTKVLTDGHQLTFDGNGDASVTGINVNGVPFEGGISGAGGVIKRGLGALAMNATNTYTGPTVIEAGVVEIQTGAALGAASSGTTVLPGTILRLRTTTAVNEPLTLSGTLEVPSFVAGGIWSGPVTLSAAVGALINASNSQPLRLTGVISGTGGFTKAGPGVLTLEADNNYSGLTVVESGTLVVTNSHLTGPLLINSTNSMLLAGGQIGPVASTGALLAAGTLAASATVDVAGNLALDAGTQFNVDLNGFAPESGHDQWRVAGNVSLGGATLNLAIRTVPSVGSTFVIIRNDGVNPVNGTFAGLPQGAQFTRGNSIWLITYAGGDGNDVALIVIGQTVLGRVWDGGGANSNWMTASNWVGDTVPATGVNLIFPTEASNRTNFNDFPAGTGFNSLNFTGVTNSSSLRYTVLGNALTITNGLVCESNANAMTFGAPLTLAGTGSIAVQSPSSLTLTGGVNTIGVDLNLSGSGTLTFNTPITSGAGLVSSAGFLQLRSNNTFAASSLISTGTVRVDANGAFGVAARTVTIDRDGLLQLQNATNLANPLVLRGRLSALRTNTWSGPITVQGTNATLGSPGNGPLTIGGIISGSGDLSLVGGSTGNELVFNATNTHTGIMRLASGLLLMKGIGTGSELHIATNQTFFPTMLTGTGAVSSVRAGGTISPGLATNAGILRVAGNLTLSNTAVLDIQVNGPGSGTGHDQLRVTGDVRIDNAALQLFQPASFLPNVTDTFVILRNDGPNPIIGTFAGLPQGAFVTNCAVFQITYTGGDGNDVALVVTAQKGMVSQWTGNGGDTNWTNGANWLCGLPPDPGDTLIFSNGIPNRITHNNFPVGTAFGRLSFLGFNSDQPFFLNGNPITLTHGIDGFFSGSNVISMPITMSAPQTFSNAFGQLALRGNIINGGHNLALAGGGTFDFVGSYSGAGGLNWTNTTFSFGSLRLRTNNPYSGLTAFDGLVAVFVYRDGALGGSAAGTFIGPSVQCLLQTPMTLNEPVTLAGRLDFANGSNLMAAPLTLEGSNRLVCISGPRMEFNGPIGGSGSFQACGIGTNFYNAGGSFDGTVEIFAGQHTFIGQYPGMDLVIGGTVNFSSTIAGTGRVRSIVASDAGTNSIIAPGVNGPGVLTVSGRFIVESNITLRMELNGTTPGTGHDQLIVGGPVALTNCALQLNFGFTPATNDTFTLVQNTGATPIAGTFDGLPEGALIINGVTVLQITYTGGTGNDIVLRPASAAPAAFNSINFSNGLIRLSILGQPNASYVIEATTNLLTPPNLTPWIPISTNPAGGNGLFQFIDGNTTNLPSRFYRVLSR